MATFGVKALAILVSAGRSLDLNSVNAGCDGGRCDELGLCGNLVGRVGDPRGILIGL